MITIKEIARQLGLSTTTVSNVIHGKTGEVSQETINRVQSFLDEVEYVPNISARNLAQNRSKIIGVVLKEWHEKYDNFLADPFVAELISGIEKKIRERGYFMMVYISDDIAEILKHISTWNADGLILFCMLDDDALRVRKKYSKPIVCIDTYAADKTGLLPGNQFRGVNLEDEEGAREAVSYLTANGHRRIGFLADNKEGVDLARFRGYRRALEEAGIEYSDRNFFFLSWKKGALDQSFRELAEKARHFTAIFCCSDLYAVNMINACTDIGIRVPEDLSVIGFDDNYLSRICRPALTTVHQDTAYKGSLAVDLLIDMIRGNDPGDERILLKTKLVIRDSVRKI